MYGDEAVTDAYRIRKNIDRLTPGETESLRNAFLSLQNSKEYEDIASYHGLPANCEMDGKSYACCIHGMPTFPQWHRLYVVNVEERLARLGSSVAVPYWDWTKSFDKLPSFINDATYFNHREQQVAPNPFFSGAISFENAVTARDPQPELFNSDYLYNNVMLAFEQDNFCDFEVQFEIVHNALHAWIGGRAKYSMSSLHYSAYDPVFFIHHSNVDRQWAIWQELQKYRGKAYMESNCALPLMNQPLRPFDREGHGVWMTQMYNTPKNTYDYKSHFWYHYDDLEFNGMTIPQLENTLQNRKKTDRVFAGFMLHGIQTSATVKIYICVPHKTGHDHIDCSNYAGEFAILGGTKEMPWAFDRLYKFDITPTHRQLGLGPHSRFDLSVEIFAVNGSRLASDTLPAPTILAEHGNIIHIIYFCTCILSCPNLYHEIIRERVLSKKDEKSLNSVPIILLPFMPKLIKGAKDNTF